ncbi:MAG TPA: NADH-quinone oxidoreductase subunit NuoG [Syntrophorhabdaceae bacterium]|nr:NADH-quinone oxidoreductase subunit NuoG [Syntrophorhabdaceae bacterium]
MTVATIYIDNKPYEATEGDNLLHACLSLGFDIPHFCWHPALHSVGACRQCAVVLFRDDQDTRGRIVMSCMTAITDGIRISIDHSEAKAFRASVIEWLMTNHPHDCPVCDEGGECHLQDMTVMTGHAYRTFRYAKRTHRNQYLGPLVNHEMNRCIQCYRCVRFYRDFAGGRDFNVFGFKNHVYFGRFEDGVLQSAFSGNLVEICPTGVFTDKTLKKHYVRKWDLQSAPSVCVHCSLGCNTIPAERYGTLRRVSNRYNAEINSYFLCDRGRYGYEFVNSPRRIRQPMMRASDKGRLEPVTEKILAQFLARALLPAGSGIIGIGSPRASLEANFALRRLVGAERFYPGLAEAEHALAILTVDILSRAKHPTPSLKDVAAHDAVFVLGEDVANTAPMMALAILQSIRRKPMEIAARLGIPPWDDRGVREACQQKRGPLFIASPQGTWLDDFASTTYRGAPDEVARLGFAVARVIDPQAPAPYELTREASLLARNIASGLIKADRPLILSGMGCGSRTLLRAAENVARALAKAGKSASISIIPAECNTMGVALMGGKTLEGALNAVDKGEAHTAIILENDLFRRTEAAKVLKLLGALRHIIVIDQYLNDTSERAEFLLPAASFTESDGTVVNNEGRAQRFFRVFAPDGAIKTSWRWLSELNRASHSPATQSWANQDEVISELAGSLPVFAPLAGVAPRADFRMIGQKIPRQSHRYSGRTAKDARVSVDEPHPQDDPDSALCFSMEGYTGQPPSSLITRFWSPGWNSVQSVNRFQKEPGGDLRNQDVAVKLIKPQEPGNGSYFDEIPDPFRPLNREFRCHPLFHVFGSDEMSMLAPAIRELAPRPYISLNADDAAALGTKDSEEVDVFVDGERYRLPARIDVSLARGLAGIPVGIAGPGQIRPSQIARIRKAEGED